MSYGNMFLIVKCKIQLVELLSSLRQTATVLKTTEADASVGSNVATALIQRLSK